MQNPWGVRQRGEKGDDTPEPIFLKVGEALSVWENLESRLAELFDCLVSGSQKSIESNRSGFSAFTAVKSSSARTELIQAAAPRALKTSAHLEKVTDFIERVSSFGARRNEIAHGRVFNLEEHGFQLCPNNTNPNKFHKKGQNIGAATYQYNSSDVGHYCAEFIKLIIECEELISAIQTERSD
jgi:hypothetical protein